MARSSLNPGVGSPIRGRPKRPKYYRAGPFRGMRDMQDPSSADPSLARMLQNVYIVDPARRSAVIGRPGIRLLGSQLAGAPKGQRSYQFTKLNGTEHSVVIAGGELYEINWAARTITKVLTAAQITGAGAALSSTARVYLVTFADNLVISDGVNKPWAWDGTAGGGITPITGAAGAWYGQPAVYYGKLFGIIAATPTDMEWSEENQLNVGYGAGGYSNQWTLGQTDQERLYLLVGTNEQLAVFRSRSSTAITGAVGPEFSSTGTREALSDTIGTESPAAAQLVNGRLFFVDADLKPRVWTPGGGITSAWEDFSVTIGGLDWSKRADAIGVYDPFTQLVLIGAAEIAETYPNILMGLFAGEGEVQAQAVWRGFSFNAIDVLRNGNGKPVLVHLTHDGYVYDHGLPDAEASETVLEDGFAAGDAPIIHIVEPPALGYDDMIVEKFWSRIDLSLRTVEGFTGLRFFFGASHVAPEPIDLAVSVNAARWDIGFWDEANWPTDNTEQHAAVGIKGYGRWLSFQLYHDALSEQFGFVEALATAFPRGAFPDVT